MCTPAPAIPTGTLAQQLGHGPMFTDQEVGSAGQVFELSVGDINPQLPVKRGKDFAEMYWALVGFFTKPAG